MIYYNPYNAVWESYIISEWPDMTTKVTKWLDLQKLKPLKEFPVKGLYIFSDEQYTEFKLRFL